MNSGDPVLSESQLGAGLVCIALVPAFVAHWQEAAILSSLDLQTAVLCEPHWGEPRARQRGELRCRLITGLTSSVQDSNVVSLACLLLLRLQVITATAKNKTLNNFK